MPNSPSSTWYIALVVVRHEEQFLLVDEKKSRGWYLPAGRVDPGESLQDGARREVLEESGIEVELEGIIRMEFTPTFLGRDARFRVVFVARPIGGELKTEPDSESMGAAWVTLDQMQQLRLRSDEVVRHIEHVAGGGTIAPLSLLAPEGAPYTS